MGRGDKRSFKGKVFRHSFGKTRPRKKKKGTAASAAPAGHKKKQA